MTLRQIIRALREAPTERDRRIGKWLYFGRLYGGGLREYKHVRCGEPGNGGPCVLNRGHAPAPNPSGHCFWT